MTPSKTKSSNVKERKPKSSKDDPETTTSDGGDGSDDDDDDEDGEGARAQDIFPARLFGPKSRTTDNIDSTLQGGAAGSGSGVAVENEDGKSENIVVCVR
jgi:hypothetical protein